MKKTTNKTSYTDRFITYNIILRKTYPLRLGHYPGLAMLLQYSPELLDLSTFFPPAKEKYTVNTSSNGTSNKKAFQ